MSAGYKTVFSQGTGQIVEKKSRFIATIRPAQTKEEAEAFLIEMKKKYWDATHNCFACVIGENGEYVRSSDDGEPGGTAGRPMLDVLLKEEIRNVAVVVTRYFGGTLLGSGGLVRAYQQAVKEGLKESLIVEKKQESSFRQYAAIMNWEGFNMCLDKRNFQCLKIYLKKK